MFVWMPVVLTRLAWGWQERKESFSYWVDPARALGQTFSAIQTDATAGDLHFGASVLAKPTSCRMLASRIA